MVKHLNNQDFEKIFSMDCYKNINDICQRIKLKNLFSSSDCKNYFKEENNKFVVDIDKIERARNINKITIANPELYLIIYCKYIYQLFKSARMIKLV